MSSRHYVPPAVLHAWALRGRVLDLTPDQLAQLGDEIGRLRKDALPRRIRAARAQLRGGRVVDERFHLTNRDTEGITR